MNETSLIFITFRKDEGKYVGHSISSNRPTPDSLAAWKDEKEDEAGQVKDAPKGETATNSFAAVADDFLSMMSTYRNMIPFTLAVSPIVSGAVANAGLGKFVQQYGASISDLETEDFTVYEVDERHFSAIIRRHEETIAATNGASHLPEIAVIGLISVYDAFLSKLLRTIFTLHQEIVFTSDKEMKFSELVKYSSIQEAKDHVIEKEVESILRNSHHEQFSWMERKFDIKLTSGLEVWPAFIELCERRNLLTHTGGQVSMQYQKICAEHNYTVDHPVGSKLVTDAAYFKKAVQIISEVGLKLCHVLWRKIEPKDREAADKHMNNTGLSLIQSREYLVAERLLDLGANTVKKHHSDKDRRMMVVNLANARRLSGNKVAASQTLEREDWSATSIDFQICVAAVKEDIPGLIELMRIAGKNGVISPSEYRDWPVFREIRAIPQFKECFEAIFEESLVISAKTMNIENAATEEADAPEDPSSGEADSTEDITKH